PGECPREVELGQVRRLRHRVEGEGLGEVAVGQVARPPQRDQNLRMAQGQTLSREAATSATRSSAGSARTSALKRSSCATPAGASLTPWSRGGRPGRDL